MSYFPGISSCRALLLRLVPREEKFFDLFEELADKIEEGGVFFLDMVENYDYSKPKIARLKVLENEADVITRTTYEQMHKTFLTPIDREDIYDLVNKMDGILDMVEASAARMYLYNVKIPARDIIDQARILNKAIKKLNGIIHALRYMKNAKMIIEACVEIHTLENEGDVVMRMAMSRLFEFEKDPIELIKWKEIFERIEEAIDICEDVSNIVEGIVLKNG
jgi:predicted phosphate transport protein (TIGR00153 family)